MFKPALGRLQIKEVFEKDLAGLELVDSATITVEQHAKKGLVANVSATAVGGTSQADLAAAIEEALGGYTVKYELK